MPSRARGHRSSPAEILAGDIPSETAVVFRLLTDHASDMIVRSDLDLTRHYVSAACREIFGYSAEEMLGENIMDIIHPDDAPAMEATQRALAAGQDRATSVYRARHKAGHWVWLESRAALVRDASGQPSELVSIVRDVTAAREAASREAEAASRLRAMNELMRRAEAMTHVGHWRLDLVNPSVFWSDEVYRIHGWSQSCVPTLQTGLECYHPEDRADVANIVAETIRTGVGFSFESRIVRPSGEVRHILSHGEAERDEDGSIVALVGTFQDITERHQLAADLRRAQRLEAIGRVAAGIAHDFNNVLQGVMGGLELILDPAISDAERQGHAATAMSSARRGAAITQGLLSYARQQALHPRRVVLRPLLEELRNLLAPLLQGRIELRIECDASCPLVEVDPDHLQRALHNLALNGIQAMPQGGVLTLRAAGARGRVLITVSDTGLGMDAATMAQVFEPFFTTKGFAGTGLGLSMVQGFARQSGGDVWLDSVLGQGTTVEIGLPAVAAHHDDPDAGFADRYSLRVLLVDDVTDVLVVTAAFLRSAGVEVVEAASGDAALSLMASAERLDVLITDYAMPGLNGIDLILHAREARPDISALLITGYTELTSVAGLPGGVHVLRKPFPRAELLEALRQTVAGVGMMAGFKTF